MSSQASGKRDRTLDIITRPFQSFSHNAAAGGIVLLIATVLALLWANSPWAQFYHDAWHTRLALSLGPFELSYTLHYWINDGLMVIFFFVVGLEIKREILTGELATVSKAIFPIAAAAGGMLIPALLYAGLNFGTPQIDGWGIPMATDIAFAIGILALLGDRVPLPLKVFLTALAIVDDMGAVLVIAVFYTSDISVLALLAGFGVLLAMALMNRLGVRSPLVYFLFGVVLWLCFLKSGVHATVAGVLAAMAIPSWTLIDEDTFLSRLRFLTAEFEKPNARDDPEDHRERVRNVAANLEADAEYVQPPLHRLERRLHPWSTFVIMPVFALANAGISIGGEMVDALTEMTTVGVVVGLVVGKQAGVTLFAWLSVRLGWASLPKGVNWKHIYAVGWLAGIGFTMSLFIAGLAFSDEGHLITAKVGIMAGSLIAGLGGYFLMSRWTRAPRPNPSS